MGYLEAMLLVSFIVALSSRSTRGQSKSDINNCGKAGFDIILMLPLSVRRRLGISFKVSLSIGGIVGVYLIVCMCLHHVGYISKLGYFQVRGHTCQNSSLNRIVATIQL